MSGFETPRGSAARAELEGLQKFAAAHKKSRVTLGDLEPAVPEADDPIDVDEADLPPSGTVPVGQHTGKQYEAVLEADPNYCRWVVNETDGGRLENFRAWLLCYAPQLRDTGEGRVYLKVPYPERRRAKEMGARWDAEKKLWYAPDATFGELLAAFPRK
jgi:hypothetical protein